MISAFIQGISPVLPHLFIILIALFSLVISWWTYSGLSSISTSKKWGLISLRASALTLLVILLFNPYLVREFSETEIPTVAVYLDNSESMSVERGEYSGINTYQNILDDFHTTKSDQFNYQYYLFDDEVYEGDELNLSGMATNIHRVMEHVRENESRYAASILFSDGIVNRGRNPLFAAQNLTKPLITVPVGDSSRVRDISIADVTHDDPVFTNSRNLITVEVQQEGFEGEESTVQLIENGELIDTRTVNYPAAASSHVIEFVRNYSEPGFYEMEVHIPPKEEEFTDRNNTFNFTLEVLDDKSNILSLAFEVHPDVASVRRLVASDQQNELIMSTYLGNNRFAGSNPLDIDQDIDLIILHGLPSAGTSVYNWLLDRSEPILYLSLPGSYRHTQNSDDELYALTNVRVERIQTLLNIHIGSISDSQTHPLLELPQIAFNRLPTLQGYQGAYQVNPVAETLLTADFQSTQTNIPLLIAADIGNRRLASVNAFGWNRYERSRQDDARNLFKELFNNLVTWTSTPPDRRTLVLEPRKSSFSENEPVEIRATLVNERGVPESNALIELQFFQAEQDERRTFRMSPEGDGVYTASIGSYPRGLYRAEATATLGNRTIGEAETRVNVSRSNLEMVNTQRDDALLQQLASVTEGIFLQTLSFDDLNRFFSDNNLQETREEITTDINYLYQNGLWFFLVIILLSAEWLIRRSVSLP